VGKLSISKFKDNRNRYDDIHEVISKKKNYRFEKQAGVQLAKVLSPPKFHASENTLVQWLQNPCLASRKTNDLDIFAGIQANLQEFEIIQMAGVAIHEYIIL
jgi:hypothetical protein